MLMPCHGCRLVTDPDALKASLGHAYRPSIPTGDAGLRRVLERLPYNPGLLSLARRLAGDRAEMHEAISTAIAKAKGD